MSTFTVLDYRYYYENTYKDNEHVEQLLAQGYVLEKWDDLLPGDQEAFMEDVDIGLDWSGIRVAELKNDVRCMAIDAFAKRHGAWLHP